MSEYYIYNIEYKKNSVYANHNLVEYCKVLEVPDNKKTLKVGQEIFVRVSGDKEFVAGKIIEIYDNKKKFTTNSKLNKKYNYNSIYSIEVELDKAYHSSRTIIEDIGIKNVHYMNGTKKTQKTNFYHYYDKLSYFFSDEYTRFEKPKEYYLSNIIKQTVQNNNTIAQSCKILNMKKKLNITGYISNLSINSEENFELKFNQKIKFRYNDKEITGIVRGIICNKPITNNGIISLRALWIVPSSSNVSLPNFAIFSDEIFDQEQKESKDQYIVLSLTEFFKSIISTSGKSSNSPSNNTDQSFFGDNNKNNSSNSKNNKETVLKFPKNFINLLKRFYESNKGKIQTFKAGIQSFYTNKKKGDNLIELLEEYNNAIDSIKNSNGPGRYAKIKNLIVKKLDHIQSTGESFLSLFKRNTTKIKTSSNLYQQIGGLDILRTYMDIKKVKENGVIKYLLRENNKITELKKEQIINYLPNFKILGNNSEIKESNINSNN